MQYIKYTNVDFITRRSVIEYPAKNGPDLPDVPGLEMQFTLESEFPTPTPTYFGTIDTSNFPEYNHEISPIWGIISVLTEDEFNEAKAQELAARKVIYSHRIDLYRDSLLGTGYNFAFSDQPGTVQTSTQRDMENIHKNGSAAMALIIQGTGATTMVFRDRENFVHQIPATEMLEMTTGAMAFGSEIYKASWEHKDTINGINGKPGITTLEDLENYSIYTNWPSQQPLPVSTPAE